MVFEVPLSMERDTLLLESSEVEVMKVELIRAASLVSLVSVPVSVRRSSSVTFSSRHLDNVVKVVLKLINLLWNFLRHEIRKNGCATHYKSIVTR